MMSGLVMSCRVHLKNNVVFKCSGHHDSGDPDPHISDDKEFTAEKLLDGFFAILRKQRRRLVQLTGQINFNVNSVIYTGRTKVSLRSFFF